MPRSIIIIYTMLWRILRVRIGYIHFYALSISAWRVTKASYAIQSTMVEQLRESEKFQRLVGSVHECLEQWHQAREKALGQLFSMSNLAEQLDVLRRCDRMERLGILSGYPQIVAFMEAKILTSFERALGHVLKEKCVFLCLLTYYCSTCSTAW